MSGLKLKVATSTDTPPERGRSGRTCKESTIRVVDLLPSSEEPATEKAVSLYSRSRRYSQACISRFSSGDQGLVFRRDLHRRSFVTSDHEGRASREAGSC